MQAKFQVFVSSTFEDLQEERRAVIEQVLNMGHIPVGMELFQASNEEQWEYVKKRVESSDYFVVVIAERYGSVDAAGLSFTRKEYEYAVEKGVPVAAFVLSKKARQTWPAVKVEHQFKDELEAFRRLVRGRLCKDWSDTHDLREAAGLALGELIKDCPRPGWIRANSPVFPALDPQNPDSISASSKLRDTVDLDLRTAAYYRSGQVLEFWVESAGPALRICLRFESNIVPIHQVARVYKPSVYPPDGVRLTKSAYFIGDNEVTSWMSVTGSMRDCLQVEYEIPDGKLEAVRDRHYWPSPVLDYSVRFRKSELFRFSVGRIVGQTDPDPLDRREAGDCIVFNGNEGGLTAQGLEWKLSRALSPPGIGSKS